MFGNVIYLLNGVENGGKIKKKGEERHGDSKNKVSVLWARGSSAVWENEYRKTEI